MIESISIFDIIKIGIGPSSSHTVGPWRAALKSLDILRQKGQLSDINSVTIDLYGSLAKTGKGHGTDIAVMMGLLGEDPALTDTGRLHEHIEQIHTTGTICLGGEHVINFAAADHICFHYQESLEFHPNGMRFRYEVGTKEAVELTYFSIGGGFVIREGDKLNITNASLPFPIQKASELLAHCQETGLSISQIVLKNEKTWRDEQAIYQRLDEIWLEMKRCIYRGCHSDGELPGGLNVLRRAPAMNRRLLESGERFTFEDWLARLRAINPTFQRILKWISCFAIATNEENAAFGRVVTAPTNGSSGVVPATLMYFVYFCEDTKEQDIRRFLLVAGELGSIFKKGATISAAMGGCQAEIGVSSAMAAGALTECLGGSVKQAMMAAEIAMEHHLGLTCDPVGGLVQIPCIERNSMGAIKAITAAHIALEGDPDRAKVSLDSVVKSMWETAQDMNIKYKETSEGGLALNIPINIVEC